MAKQPPLSRLAHVLERYTSMAGCPPQVGQTLKPVSVIRSSGHPVVTLTDSRCWLLVPQAEQRHESAAD